MKFVKAINYTGFNYHCIGEEKTKENLQLMKKKTACNTVILVLGALQEDPQSNFVDYRHSAMPKDLDLIDFIRFAKSLELQVILKPVVECRDGSSRSEIAHSTAALNEWLKSYTDFILHYAQIAEKTGCEMLFIGCRLLHLQSRMEFWNPLISQVREKYHGMLTYEADLYNEENIPFWDELDAVASSGNYSMNVMQKALERLEQLAKAYNKPLFMTECGCMSTKGASVTPDAWYLEGELSLEEQVSFFTHLFELCQNEKTLRGLGIWCWNNRRLTEKASQMDKRYFIYGKPVCQFIYESWMNKLLFCS